MALLGAQILQQQAWRLLEYRVVFSSNVTWITEVIAESSKRFGTSSESLPIGSCAMRLYILGTASNLRSKTCWTAWLESTATFLSHTHGNLEFGMIQRLVKRIRTILCQII